MIPKEVERRPIHPVQRTLWDKGYSNWQKSASIEEIADVIRKFNSGKYGEGWDINVIIRNKLTLNRVGLDMINVIVDIIEKEKYDEMEPMEVFRILEEKYPLNIR